MDGLIDTFTDPQILLAVCAAVAVIATVMTIAMPLLERDGLQKRMRHVALERDRIRARERARMEREKVSLRHEPKAYMKNIVERFRLRQGLMTEQTRDKLRMAGFRSEANMIAFLFARLVLPLVCFLLALVYMFGIAEMEQPPLLRVCFAMGAAYAGFYLPNIYISNTISKRQQSIKRAFPDALDLLLICVESGMSIEVGFRRVAGEIGVQSIPLAEELSLTTAELSYLPDRRQAYENLGKRTGNPGIKAVAASLIQAERYGTPLGNALRVMAQENRDMRMMDAEKKAAGLPPKLTVPMILFFLPVLFIVILGPAAIRLMAI